MFCHRARPHACAQMHALAECKTRGLQYATCHNIRSNHTASLFGEEPLQANSANAAITAARKAVPPVSGRTLSAANG